MIEKLLLRYGYIRKQKIKSELFAIILSIQNEIDSCPQYPNVGKKGCLRRISNLYEEI